MACGSSRRSSFGSGLPPSLRLRYHSSPASRPALQVPITTPQRSAGIGPTPTPQRFIASSEAFIVKSIARSWNPSGFRYSPSKLMSDWTSPPMSVRKPSIEMCSTLRIATRPPRTPSQ